jgi:glutaredoxin 2
MKSKDTQLLEEAYEKVLHDKGHQSIEELTKEINAYKEKANNPRLSDGMKKNYEKIIKAMMEKRAKMVGGK